MADSRWDIALCTLLWETSFVCCSRVCCKHIWNESVKDRLWILCFCSMFPTKAEHGLISRAAAVMQACNHSSPSVSSLWSATSCIFSFAAARSVVTQCFMPRRLRKRLRLLPTLRPITWSWGCTQSVLVNDFCGWLEVSQEFWQDFGFKTKSTWLYRIIP